MKLGEEFIKNVYDKISYNNVEKKPKFYVNIKLSIIFILPNTE